MGHERPLRYTQGVLQAAEDRLVLVVVQIRVEAVVPSECPDPGSPEGMVPVLEGVSAPAAVITSEHVTGLA